MSLTLTWIGHASRGPEPNRPCGRHYWHIAVPDSAGRVVLYRRAAELPMRNGSKGTAVGRFPGLTDARLAALLLDAVVGGVPPQPDPAELDVVRMGTTFGNLVLREDATSVRLLLECSGTDDEIAQMLEPSSTTDLGMPPGQAVELCRRILLRLAVLRLRRADISPLEPLTPRDVTCDGMPVGW